MYFGIRKSGVVILQTGKVTRTDGIKLSDGQEKKDENGDTYLEIVETYKIKEKKIKEKITKEYLQKLRLMFKSKLPGRNRT